MVQQAVGLIDPTKLIQSFTQGKALSEHQAKQSALQQLMPAAMGGDPNALGALSQVMPELAMQISGRQQRQSNADRTYDLQVSQAADAKDWRKTQAVENKRRWDAQYKLSLDNAAETAAYRKAVLASKKDAKSKIGKLSQDFRNGYIDEPTFKAGVASLNAPGIRIDENGKFVSSGLSKSTTSAVQKSLVDEKLLLDSYQNIRKAKKDDYLTYKGQLKGDYEQFRERAQGLPGSDLLPATGKDTAEFIKGRTAFRNQTQQAFNMYRKLITGAAAPMAELKMLQDTFLSDQMSPSQFDEALNIVEGKTRRAIQIRKDLLAKGIELNSPEAIEILNTELMDRPGMPKTGEVLTGPAPWKRYQRGE